jgi:Na+/phosphate symporter
MSVIARRAALANLVFNSVGVLLILPFMVSFADFVVGAFGDNDMAVASAHLLFNLGLAAVGFVILKPVARILEPRLLI